MIYKTSNKPIVTLSHYLYQVWDTFQQASGALKNAQFHFEDFKCDWEIAMTFGMVFSELASNIVKHGSQGDDPEVRFELSKDESGIMLSSFNSIDNPVLNIEQSSNHGTKIIQALLQKYLGSLEIKYTGNALLAIIRLPSENPPKLQEI